MTDVTYAWLKAVDFDRLTTTTTSRLTAFSCHLISVLYLCTLNILFVNIFLVGLVSITCVPPPPHHMVTAKKTPYEIFIFVHIIVFISRWRLAANIWMLFFFLNQHNLLHCLGINQRYLNHGWICHQYFRILITKRFIIVNFAAFI